MQGKRRTYIASALGLCRPLKHSCPRFQTWANIVPIPTPAIPDNIMMLPKIKSTLNQEVSCPSLKQTHFDLSAEGRASILVKFRSAAIEYFTATLKIQIDSYLTVHVLNILTHPKKFTHLPCPPTQSPGDENHGCISYCWPNVCLVFQ